MSCMRLSIITINYNDADGLRRTIQSVNAQSSKEFEHIIVDGNSTDGSVDVIRQMEDVSVNRRWISEPDSGIYNAMNKGIRMAKGDYIQILNSADELAVSDVTERMLAALEREGFPSILYGNMVKVFPDGSRVCDKCFAGQEITFMGFYTGTLNHNPTYIRRSLFDTYGFYDENLKIVSDWKWYMQAIILGEEKPVYADMDVTLFDMTGVSENPANKAVLQAERDRVLAEYFPATVLADYERYAFPVEQMNRIQRYPLAYKVVYFIERVLFKYEKWQFKRTNIMKVR